MPEFKPLTETRAAEMQLTYFIKRGNEDEKEVTLTEYMEALSDGVKSMGPSDHVPRMFMGGGMTGWVGGEDEEKLV